MRRVASGLRHQPLERRIRPAFQFRDLSQITVLVIAALNDQGRDAQVVDDVIHIPRLEQRIEPRAIPAPERVVRIGMIPRHPGAQTGIPERLCRAGDCRAGRIDATPGAP